MEGWLGLIGSVVVALLSLAGVLISEKNTTKTLLEQVKAQSELADERVKAALAVTDTRLENLTREVRTHNGFAERIPVIEEKLRVANHRIDDLEKNKPA